MSLYSYNNYGSISDLFLMFPSLIREPFQMGPGKLSDRLCKVFSWHLFSRGKVTGSECHVVSFNKSFNGFTKTCQVDLLIRY